MSIKNLKIQQLIPNETDKEISKLLPTILIPYHASFDINNINVAIANGLRRVILSELQVKSMKAKLKNFSTTDHFILGDFILNRLQNIPINQNIPDDTKFELDVINKTESIMNVKTKDIKILNTTHKKLPFNDTYTLIQLNPNKSLKISDIYIKKNYGYNHGGHSVACNVVSIPTDIDMYDSFTKIGVRSSISDPKNFKITFNSNGNMEADKIIISACEEIIRRLNNLKDRLDTIEVQNDIHVLHIEHESDTIGNIIIKSINDLYPQISIATYNCNIVTHEMTIKIRSKDNAKDIINNVIDKNIKLLESLKKQV